MNWPIAYTPYIWPMLASAALMTALAGYGWKHRTLPGAIAFTITVLGIALWGLFTGIEIATTTVDAKSIWHIAEAMAAMFSLTGLMGLAIEYANPGQRLTRRLWLWLCAPLFVVFPLAATNGWHHLIWSRFWFDQFLRVDRGPLNFLVVGYALALPTLAFFMFLWLALSSRGIYRAQAIILFVGNALPTLTFLLEPMGINPVAPLDPVILVFNITGLLYMVAIYRFGMLSLIPVGRETAMERMADGLLILDAQKRIIDLNPAALKILGISARRVRGQNLAAWPACAPVFERLDGAGASSSEITLGAGDQARHYELNVSPLTDPHGSQFGCMLLLHDKTEERRSQALLLEKQRALAMLAERERLARELHDSIGQVLGYVKIQAQTAREWLAQDKKAEADSGLTTLIAVAQDAHADLRDYIFAAQSATVAGFGLLPLLRQYLTRFQQHYEMPVELTVAPDWTDDLLEPTVEAQLLRIIQEALNNVRKHAQARTVQVRLEVQERHAQIVVQDDGAGFELTRQGTREGQYGLGFMRDRAEEVGGSLVIQSAPGRGTQVVICIPRKDTRA